jgi:phosphoglycolate phosphatase
MAPADILNAINEEATRAPLVEAAPLGALLNDLRRRGLRLGVVTNDAEALAHAHLEAANVSECFDFIAGFDSGFGAKPNPGPLLAFADKVGVSPDATLMVGDSLHDLKAAHAAGMQAVGVLTGLATQNELAVLAHHVLPDIGHLPAMLEAD